MGAGTSKARPLSIERLLTPSRSWPCPQAAHFLGPKPWRPRSLGVLITDLKPALCFPSFSPHRKNSLFEFVSPHHLHCPGELLAKARGENLFRDENATVRGGLPSAQMARKFASPRPTGASGPLRGLGQGDGMLSGRGKGH